MSDLERNDADFDTGRDIPAGSAGSTAGGAGTPREFGGGYGASGASGASGAGERVYSGDDPNRQATRIERQIEQTRERMSNHIDELGERLNPATLKAQAREHAVEAVRDTTVYRTGSRVVDMVRDNPIPAAMMGVGAAWLFASSRSSGRRFDYEGPDRRLRYRTGGSYGYGGTYEGNYGTAGYAYGEAGRTDDFERSREFEGSSSSRGLMDRVGETKENVTEKVSDALSSAKETVSDTTSRFTRRAGDVADRTRERASRLGGAVTNRAGRARGTVQRSYNENPLPMALGALAFGLVAGLLVPATRRENELMGATRDELLDRTRETAQRVKEVAGETLQSEAQQLAPEVKAAAKHVAREAKDSAARVADEVKTTAKDEVKSAGSTGAAGSTAPGTPGSAGSATSSTASSTRNAGGTGSMGSTGSTGSQGTKGGPSGRSGTGGTSV